jgi:hypothetical protein
VDRAANQQLAKEVVMQKALGMNRRRFSGLQPQLLLRAR